MKSGYEKRIKKIIDIFFFLVCICFLCIQCSWSRHVILAEKESNDLQPGKKKIQNQVSEEERDMKPWLELEILVEITGETYNTKKEELLSGNSDIKTELLKFTDHQNWQTACTAQILVGWIEQRKLYEEVLKELDGVDAERERKTAAGLFGIWDTYALKARDHYKKDILPLCWEVILKYHNTWEDWKVITFLAMLGAVPDESSVEPLAGFIETSKHVHAQDYAAQRLGGFPESMVKSRLESLKKRHQDIIKTIDSALLKLDFEG